MSWKILVSAGLLCVVVSPAFAAPTLTVDLVRSGGLPVLDASGNWQWAVSVSPDATLFTNSGPSGTPPNTLGGSVAVELGFTAATVNGNLVGVTKNATNFPSDNPGTPIGAGFPVNTNTTATGVQILGNNASVNLGSTFFTAGTPQQVAIITTKGPSSTGSLSTNLSWSGAYSGNGRIAQAGVNNDTFSGSLTKTVLGGDVNLNGTVNIADFGILQTNFNQSGKHWQDGDINGNGTVNIADFGILQTNFNQTLPPAPGGGAGVGGAVPEPGSMVLLAIGSLFLIARKFRR